MEECHVDIVGDSPDECASLDDPESWPFFHANEYSFLSASFAILAAIAALSPTPLCTAPLAVAGAPQGLAVSRACAPWLWLAAVNFYILKDGAERGRLWMKRFWRLRRGVALMSFSRLVTAMLALGLTLVSGLPAGIEMRLEPPVCLCLALFALSAKAVRRTENQGGVLFRGRPFSGRQPPSRPED